MSNYCDVNIANYIIKLHNNKGEIIDNIKIYCDDNIYLIKYKICLLLGNIYYKHILLYTDDNISIGYNILYNDKISKNIFPDDNIKDLSNYKYVDNCNHNLLKYIKNIDNINNINSINIYFKTIDDYIHKVSNNILEFYFNIGTSDLIKKTNCKDIFNDNIKTIVNNYDNDTKNLLNSRTTNKIEKCTLLSAIINVNYDNENLDTEYINLISILQHIDKSWENIIFVKYIGKETQYPIHKLFKFVKKYVDIETIEKWITSDVKSAYKGSVLIIKLMINDKPTYENFNYININLYNNGKYEIKITWNDKYNATLENIKECIEIVNNFIKNVNKIKFFTHNNNKPIIPINENNYKIINLNINYTVNAMSNIKNITEIIKNKYNTIAFLEDESNITANIRYIKINNYNSIDNILAKYKYYMSINYKDNDIYNLLSKEFILDDNIYSDIKNKYNSKKHKSTKTTTVKPVFFGVYIKINENSNKIYVVGINNINIINHINRFIISLFEVPEKIRTKITKTPIEQSIEKLLKLNISAENKLYNNIHNDEDIYDENTYYKTIIEAYILNYLAKYGENILKESNEPNISNMDCDIGDLIDIEYDNLKEIIRANNDSDGNHLNVDIQTQEQEQDNEKKNQKTQQMEIKKFENIYDYSNIIKPTSNPPSKIKRLKSYDNKNFSEVNNNNIRYAITQQKQHQPIVLTKDELNYNINLIKYLKQQETSTENIAELNIILDKLNEDNYVLFNENYYICVQHFDLIKNIIVPHYIYSKLPEDAKKYITNDDATLNANTFIFNDVTNVSLPCCSKKKIKDTSSINSKISSTSTTKQNAKNYILEHIYLEEDRYGILLGYLNDIFGPYNDNYKNHNNKYLRYGFGHDKNTFLYAIYKCLKTSGIIELELEYDDFVEKTIKLCITYYKIMRNGDLSVMFDFEHFKIFVENKDTILDETIVWDVLSYYYKINIIIFEYDNVFNIKIPVGYDLNVLYNTTNKTIYMLKTLYEKNYLYNIIVYSASESIKYFIHDNNNAKIKTLTSTIIAEIKLYISDAFLNLNDMINKLTEINDANGSYNINSVICDKYDRVIYIKLKNNIILPIKPSANIIIKQGVEAEGDNRDTINTYNKTTDYSTKPELSDVLTLLSKNIKNIELNKFIYKNKNIVGVLIKHDYIIEINDISIDDFDIHYKEYSKENYKRVNYDNVNYPSYIIDNSISSNLPEKNNTTRKNTNMIKYEYYNYIRFRYEFSYYIFNNKYNSQYNEYNGNYDNIYKITEKLINEFIDEKCVVYNDNNDNNVDFNNYIINNVIYLCDERKDDRYDGHCNNDNKLIIFKNNLTYKYDNIELYKKKITNEIFYHPFMKNKILNNTLNNIIDENKYDYNADYIYLNDVSNKDNNLILNNLYSNTLDYKSKLDKLYGNDEMIEYDKIPIELLTQYKMNYNIILNNSSIPEILYIVLNYLDKENYTKLLSIKEKLIHQISKLDINNYIQNVYNNKYVSMDNIAEYIVSDDYEDTIYDIYLYSIFYKINIIIVDDNGYVKYPYMKIPLLTNCKKYIILYYNEKENIYNLVVDKNYKPFKPYYEYEELNKTFIENWINKCGPFEQYTNVIIFDENTTKPTINTSTNVTKPISKIKLKK